MGRSFKLQTRSQPKKKYAKPKEGNEVKVVYDHRPQVKTNPKIIAEFMKIVWYHPNLGWTNRT